MIDDENCNLLQVAVDAQGPHHQDPRHSEEVLRILNADDFNSSLTRGLTFRKALLNIKFLFCFVCD